MHGLGGVLGKGGVEGVRVPALEKYQVLSLGWVLFQREIHAVFSGHSLKGLDIFIGNLDVLHPRALLHELLHCLLPVMGLGVPGLLQIAAHGRFQQVSGEPAARFAYVDDECHGFVPYFVLQSSSLLSKLSWEGSPGLTAPGFSLRGRALLDLSRRVPQFFPNGFWGHD